MTTGARSTGRSVGVGGSRADRRAWLAGVVGLVWMVVVGTVLTGCGSPTEPSAAPSSAPPARAAPSSSAAGGSGEPSPPTASGPTAVADPDLFEVLPATDDVLSLTYDPITSAAIASDPGLDPAVASLATGLYRLRDAPADAPDFAIVNVVRLRDLELDDDWYRSWRETYDEGACGQAGGVTRRAETPVGDVTVHVGSCAGGAFTYHVRLIEGDVILSMTSVGPARIGQAVTQRMGR